MNNNAAFHGLGGQSAPTDDKISIDDFFFTKGVAERRLTRFVSSLALGQLETCQALVEEYEHQLATLTHPSSDDQVITSTDPAEGLTGFQATLAMFKARKAQEDGLEEQRWRQESIHTLRSLLPQLRSMLMSVEMRTLDVAEEDDSQPEVVTGRLVKNGSPSPTEDNSASATRRPLPYLSSQFRIAPSPTILCKESLPFALMLSHRREVDVAASAHYNPSFMISLLNERSKVLPTGTNLATASDPNRRLPVLLFVLVRSLLSVPEELWNVVRSGEREGCDEETVDRTQQLVAGHQAAIRALSNFLFDLDTPGACDFQKYVLLLKYLSKLVAAIRVGRVLEEDDVVEDTPDTVHDRMKRWHKEGGGSREEDSILAEKAHNGANHPVFEHLALLWHFTRQYVSLESYQSYFDQLKDDIPVHACKLAVRALAIFAGAPSSSPTHQGDEDVDRSSIPSPSLLCYPQYLREDLPVFIRAVLSLHPQTRAHLELYESYALRELNQSTILPNTPTASLTVSQLVTSKVDVFEMALERIHKAVLYSSVDTPQLLLGYLKQVFEDPFLVPFKPFVAFELYGGGKEVGGVDLLRGVFHGPHGGTSSKPGCLRIQDHQLIIDFLTKDTLGGILEASKGPVKGAVGPQHLHPCLPWFNELRCTWQLLTHFQTAVKVSNNAVTGDNVPGLLERVLWKMLGTNGGVLDALYLVTSDANPIPAPKRSQLLASIAATITQTLTSTYPEISDSSPNRQSSPTNQYSLHLRSPRYDVNMATQLACLQGVGLLQAVLQQIDTESINKQQTPVDWSKLTRSFYQALRTTSLISSKVGAGSEIGASVEEGVKAVDDLKGNALAEVTIEIVLTLATQRILLPELQRQHDEGSEEDSTGATAAASNRALERFCSVVSALEENLKECISQHVLTALRVIIFRARQLLRSARSQSDTNQTILPPALHSQKVTSLLEPVVLVNSQTPAVRSPTSHSLAASTSAEQLLKAAFSDSPFQLLKEAVVERRDPQAAHAVMCNLFTRVTQLSSEEEAAGSGTQGEAIGGRSPGGPLLLFTFLAIRLHALTTGSISLDDFVSYLDDLSDRLLESSPSLMRSFAGISDVANSAAAAALPPALLSRADLWFHAPSQSSELVSALAEGAAAEGDNSLLEHDFFAMLACVSSSVGESDSATTADYYQRLTDISLQPGARVATLRSCLDHLRMAKQVCSSTTTTGSDFLKSIQVFMDVVRGDGYEANPALLWKPAYPTSKSYQTPNYLLKAATYLRDLSVWLPKVSNSLGEADGAALSVAETLRTAHDLIFRAAATGVFIQEGSGVGDALIAALLSSSDASSLSPSDIAATVVHEYVIKSMQASPRLFGGGDVNASVEPLTFQEEVNVLRSVEYLLTIHATNSTVSPEVVPAILCIVSPRTLDIIHSFQLDGDKLFKSPVTNEVFNRLAKGHLCALTLRILERQLRRQAEGEDDSSSGDDQNGGEQQDGGEGGTHTQSQTFADFRSSSDPFATFHLATQPSSQIEALSSLIDNAVHSAKSDRDLHHIFHCVDASLLTTVVSSLLSSQLTSSARDQIVERILWAVLTLPEEASHHKRTASTDSSTTSLRGSFRGGCGRRSRSNSVRMSAFSEVAFAKNKPHDVADALIELLLSSTSELCVRCNFVAPTSKRNSSSYFHFVKAVSPKTHLACLERIETELRLRIFGTWGDAVQSSSNPPTFSGALVAASESKDDSLTEMLTAVVHTIHAVKLHIAFVTNISRSESQHPKPSSSTTTTHGGLFIEAVLANKRLPFLDLEATSLVNLCEQVVRHVGGVAGSADLVSVEPGEEADRKEETTMDAIRSALPTSRLALDTVYDMLVVVRSMFPAALICGGGAAAATATSVEGGEDAQSKEDPSVSRWSQGLPALLRSAAIVGSGIQIRMTRLDIPQLFCGASNIGRQRMNQYRSAAAHRDAHDKLNQRRELKLIQTINAIATREFTIYVPNLTGGSTRKSKPVLSIAPLVALMSAECKDPDPSDEESANNSRPDWDGAQGGVGNTAIDRTKPIPPVSVPFTTVTQELIGALVTLVDLSLEAQHRAIRYVMSSKELSPLFGGYIMGRPQQPTTRWHKILQGLDTMIRLLDRERQEALLLATVVKESGKVPGLLKNEDGSDEDDSSSSSEEDAGGNDANNEDNAFTIDAVFGRAYTAKPLLLVENLLMCQRVADVAAILPLVQNGREKDCDNLLLKYAHLAVDISRYDDLPPDEFPHGKTEVPKTDLEPPLRPPPLKRWIAANANPSKIREVRNKFSYTNTPNMSLFKQMVRLCSDKDAAMESSLKFAEHLFDSLAEYDAASKVIVIDTAEHVLMSLEPPSARQTKLMRMFQVSRHLVLCKWGEHPQKGELEDNGSVMELIQRLLSKGHMKAAFAIAEVCGLDISGVQALWMDRVTQLLDLGMYTEAGDAFSHLRGTYLEDALGYLRNVVEGAPLSSGFRAHKGNGGQYSIRNVPEKDVPSLLTHKRNGITALLRRFGTRIDLLGFFVRVGDLGAATAIALDSCKDHKPEVISLYLQPMVERGSSEVLRAVIKDRDPTLAAMRPLIELCCSHLDKIRNLDELYSWQKWMHDYALAAHTATLLSQSESKFEAKLEYLKEADMYLVEAKLQPTMKLAHPPFAEDGVELPLLTYRMDHQKIQLALILCRLQQELITTLNTNGEDCNRLSVYGDIDGVTRMCVDLIIMGKPFIDLSAKIAETLSLDASSICKGAVAILVGDKRHDVIEAVVEYYSKKVTGVPTLQKNYIFFEIFKVCAQDGVLVGSQAGSGGNKKSAKIANNIINLMTAEGGRRVIALLMAERYTQAATEAFESGDFKSVESVYETAAKTTRTAEIEELVNKTRHWLSRNKH